MASLSSDEKARIVANNKSLRLIKNELEFLAERDVLSDEAYDTILKALPAESALRAQANAVSTPTTTAHVPSQTYTTPTSQHQPQAQPEQPTLADSFSSLSVNQPQLPQRSPTPSLPTKPELCHATALYNYPATDPGDLPLQRDDHISVTTYENAEWWSGTNIRTGQFGIFPRNYIRVEDHPSSLSHQGAPPQYNEKQQYNPYQTQQPQYPQGPYQSSVPPMAVANDQGQAAMQQPNKGKEFGKKVAGKFGNAAVFGAGATVGSNIINSIF